MGAQQCCQQSQSQAMQMSKRENKNLARRKYKGLTFEVNEGQICKEPVEVIVLIANSKLEISHVLSKNVLYNPCLYLRKLCGDRVKKSVEEQLRNSQTQEGQCMFVETDNGQFKYIFLAILPEESAIIGNNELMRDSYLWLDQIKQENLNLGCSQKLQFQRQYVYECLQSALRLAQRLKVMSISFPVLEYNRNKSTKSDSQIATTMLMAVKEFLRESSDVRHLKEITFCMENSEALQVFVWTLKRVLNDSQLFQESEFTQVVNKTGKSYPTSHYESNVQGSSINFNLENEEDDRYMKRKPSAKSKFRNKKIILQEDQSF